MNQFEVIKQQDQSNIAHTYARFPLAIEQGKNASCTDFDEKGYIDFTSGIGVNALGFCDEGWVSAVTAQLCKLQHISNLYYTKPCIDAAALLTEKTGMKKVFFSNSGAEANEGAIKAARKYSLLKYGPNRSKIISLTNSFHGRTITTLAATGQESFHKYFFPFTEGFVFAEANNLADLAEKTDGSVCAVMMELVQGEGGVLPLDQVYVQGVSAFCEKNDLLLIIDEVQTGMGRTGSLYAFQQYGITPDILTSAKGLGGGLPVGAILFNDKTEGVFVPGDHASTFGGNPVACAGAVEILSRMDAAFLLEVQQKGAYMKEKILGFPSVAGVTGMGLMIGISLTAGLSSADVVVKGIAEGVLLLTAKEKVRLLPPLTITYQEIDRGLAALEKTLSKIGGTL